VQRPVTASAAGLQQYCTGRLVVLTCAWGARYTVIPATGAAEAATEAQSAGYPGAVLRWLARVFRMLLLVLPSTSGTMT
jgi:hypothetical protein